MADRQSPLERSTEPSKMPRLDCPNDILPDVNPLSEARKGANEMEVKCVSSNPRG